MINNIIKNKVLLFYFILNALVISINLKSLNIDNCAITYALDCGRFGNQLSNYIKALWFSWKYDLQFIYKPFDYSDKLKLSKLHQLKFNNRFIKKFKKQFKTDKTSKSLDDLIKDLRIIKNNKKVINTTLYNISFHTPIWEFEDEDFRKKLNELIQPIEKLNLLNLPDNHVSIAVHVRSRNNKFDIKADIDQMPTKFPPHSFYLNGLKVIANKFKDKKLYIYIFTDDPNPISIRDKFLKKLKDMKIKNFKIECRNTKNNHDINVLEDFFSLLKFNCLIRPNSSFSGCASIISAPLMEIVPNGWNNFTKDKNGNIVINSLVKEREDNGKEIIKTYVV